MQILKAGGILMYFILLMGIIGLYAILERFSYFAIKERNNFSKLPSDVRQLINEGKIKEAIVALNSNKSSTSLVLKEILIYGYKENDDTKLQRDDVPDFTVYRRARQRGQKRGL